MIVNEFHGTTNYEAKSELIMASRLGWWRGVGILFGEPHQSFMKTVST